MVLDRYPLTYKIDMLLKSYVAETNLTGGLKKICNYKICLI